MYKTFSNTLVTGKVHRAVLDQKRNPRKGNLAMRKAVMIKTVMDMSQKLTQNALSVKKKIN